MTRSKRVLVTGASGYIGSLLCNKILKSDYGLSLLDTKVHDNFGLGNIIGQSEVNIFEGDIRDRNILSSAVTGIDTLIHLAGISDGRMGKINPSLTREINYESFDNMLEIAKGSGVKRVLFASTFGVYGNSYVQKLDESLKINPEDIYSETKALCEALLVKHNSDEFTTASLRIAMVYGLSPSMRYEFLVNNLSQTAKVKGELVIMGGSQKRPQIHVQDITDYFLKLISVDANLISGEAFNAVGENPTILDIAKIIKNHLPNTEIKILPSRPNEVSFELDGRKILQKIGIEPSYSISEGVLEILNNS